MAQVLELPVTFTDRAIIEGEMNSLRNTALITGTIPHLWYKKSHIEDAFSTKRFHRNGFIHRNELLQ